jgi:hypothetical protein
MPPREFYNELDILIDEYLDCAKYSCLLLKQVYSGKETFLRAKVLKLIPKEGVIENVFYQFHGTGCYFEYTTNHIDIDFGPNNRCDGFDLFRLKDFFSTIIDKRKYVTLMEDANFIQQFEELLKAEIIYNPKSEPSPHLFFRTDKLNSNK